MSAPHCDVKYVARLARLELTPDEERKLGGQLNAILDYFAKLRELDVTGIEPMAHAVPLANITRPDEVRPSLPTAEALRNAPAQANGLFTVPKIVE
ncbi:MAG: Asp-tRNA(Asn)/Glu-tRNA(Gln) amidotransferase subunit GatC [Verrucomicrobia bacterium]|jgi:aspartyl-tRNA(Asn)/glutamyl-tRNA(Gln) amidotransferase subunit C|nr:Asp-tRNA(Asn)/Glu-tRNA(Gln) amidotransferase subunit GatC [Verrucomicrobiota bacterium]